MKKQAVVVMSGGLDSSVLLHFIVKKIGIAPSAVMAISFDYGQRHKQELDLAIYQANKLGVKHIIMSLPIHQVFKNSALLDSSLELPEDHYTHENQKITVVPNRNMIMLSIAAGLAESLGAARVYYGAHANDRAIYPDCRPEFVKALEEAILLGTYGKPRLLAPFIDWTKAEIVREGADAGVDFSKTWSCYRGGKKACGKCATCQERLEAFKLAGLTDPLAYEADDMKEEKLSWEDIELMTLSLADKIRDGRKTYTGIYAIPRGGLIPGVRLSHLLKLPLVAAPGPGILIVDDISDTGTTLAKLDLKGCDIATLLWHKQTKVMPTYTIREKKDRWIVYPWELL